MRVTIIFLLSLMLAACNAEPEASIAAVKKKKKTKVHLVEMVTAASVASSTVSNWHGSLEYNERVHIYNQEKGRIDSFPYREGDLVKKGELLVHMDDRLLRAEKDRLLAQIVQAKSDWKRIKRLVNKQAISAEELEKAKTQLAIYDAEKKILDIRIGYFKIRAPFSGIVTERFANQGDAVSEQEHLLTLSNHRSLVAKVQVSESAQSSLEKDMPASIIIPSSGKKYAGKIARIYPKLHPSTRQATVEITFNKLPNKLFSGQSVLAEIKGVRKNRVLVPLSALKRDADGEHIYLLKDDGKAYRQAVISAAYIAGKVEITQGVKRGDKVITRGFLGLNNGKRVKVTGKNKQSKNTQTAPQKAPLTNQGKNPDKTLDNILDPKKP